MGQDNVSLSLDEIIKKQKKGGKGKINRKVGGKFIRGRGGAGKKFVGGGFKGKGRGGKGGLRTKGAAGVMKGRGKFRSDNFNNKSPLLKRLGGRGKFNKKNKLLPGGANATSGGRIRVGRNGLFTSAKSRRGGIVGGNNIRAIRGRPIQNRRQNFKSAFTGFLQSGQRQRQRSNNLIARRQQNPFFQQPRSEGIFSSLGLGSRRGQNNQLRAVAQRKVNRARLILLKRNINRALRENINAPQQQQQQPRYVNRGGGRVGRFTGRVQNQRVAQNIQSKINRARMARDTNRSRLIDDLPSWRSQPAAGPSTLIRSSQLRSYNYDYPTRRPAYPMKNLAIRTINEHAHVQSQAQQYNYNSPMTRIIENRQPEDEMTRPSLDPEIQRTILYLQSRGGGASSHRIAPDYKASSISTQLKLSDRFKRY